MPGPSRPDGIHKEHERAQAGLARHANLVPIAALTVLMIAALMGFAGHEVTLEAIAYYQKLPPDIGETEVIVVDPMLATGGSATAAIDYLKRHGVRGGAMKFMCLVAAPEGIRHLHENHPDVPIYTAAIDRELNDRAYILPGLGDAGDRIFGT